MIAAASSELSTFPTRRGREKMASDEDPPVTSVGDDTSGFGLKARGERLSSNSVFPTMPRGDHVAVPLLHPETGNHHQDSGNRSLIKPWTGDSHSGRVRGRIKMADREVVNHRVRSGGFMARIW
jgi:hypothetical protein